jgi:hypothetical protein
MIQEMGRVMGYKDVSNYVAGPKHTRHAIHERIAKLNSDSGAAYRPFWEGYERGARRTTKDRLNHIYKATGGQRTRTYRKLLRLSEKI